MPLCNPADHHSIISTRPIIFLATLNQPIRLLSRESGPGIKAVFIIVCSRVHLYEIIAECPAFQSGDECINENNSLLIGITWDVDRDAPPFKAGRVHFLPPAQNELLLNSTLK